MGLAEEVEALQVGWKDGVAPSGWTLCFQSTRDTCRTGKRNVGCPFPRVTKERELGD